MNFKFTVEDFLNDFGAGFVFLFGLLVTNHEKLLSKIILVFKDNENSLFLNSIFLLILVYTIGLTLSAITNFLEQDFYLLIDGLIRKTYKKERKYLKDKIKHILINIPLFYINRCTFYLFFRRWATIETMMRIRVKFKKLEARKHKLSEKYEELLRIYGELKNDADKKSADKKSAERELKKLEAKKENSAERYAEFCRKHEALHYIIDKSIEEIYSIEKTLKKESSTFGMLYWYKSQFWQISSNAVFFIFIINLFVFKSVDFISKSAIIYLASFFLFKLMSPMYIKMYLRQMFRENIALEKIKKENSGKN
jgi:hypothetical protein